MKSLMFCQVKSKSEVIKEEGMVYDPSPSSGKIPFKKREK